MRESGRESKNSRERSRESNYRAERELKAGLRGYGGRYRSKSQSISSTSRSTVVYGISAYGSGNRYGFDEGEASGGRSVFAFEDAAFAFPE